MNKQFDCLPEEDRPYEKCIRYGVQALTNRELLAVILRTGAKGKHVLDLAGELLNLVPEREGFTGIRRLSMTELSAVHGIGNTDGRGYGRHLCHAVGRDGGMRVL